MTEIIEFNDFVLLNKNKINIILKCNYHVNKLGKMENKVM